LTLDLHKKMPGLCFDSNVLAVVRETDRNNIIDITSTLFKGKPSISCRVEAPSASTIYRVKYFSAFAINVSTAVNDLMISGCTFDELYVDGETNKSCLVVTVPHTTSGSGGRKASERTHPGDAYVELCRASALSSLRNGRYYDNTPASHYFVDAITLLGMFEAPLIDADKEMVHENGPPRCFITISSRLNLFNVYKAISYMNDKYSKTTILLRNTESNASLEIVYTQDTIVKSDIDVCRYGVSNPRTPSSSVVGPPSMSATHSLSANRETHNGIPSRYDSNTRYTSIQRQQHYPTLSANIDSSRNFYAQSRNVSTGSAMDGQRFHHSAARSTNVTAGHITPPSAYQHDTEKPRRKIEKPSSQHHKRKKKEDRGLGKLISDGIKRFFGPSNE
jgi:hypothetical protein